MLAVSMYLLGVCLRVCAARVLAHRLCILALCERAHVRVRVFVCVVYSCARGLTGIF